MDSIFRPYTVRHLKLLDLVCIGRFNAACHWVEFRGYFEVCCFILGIFSVLLSVITEFVSP